MLFWKLSILLTMSCIASQYDPGVMDRVIATRQAGLTSMNLPQALPKVDGYIALESCARIGEIVRIRHEGDPWESFLVTDCSGHVETTDWMLRNNIFGEVDYETAVRWNVLGRGAKIEVLLGERRGYAYD